MDKNKKQPASCGYKEGAFPPCAPLAVPYVAAQSGATPQYEPGKALVRGTLFPGLDLPLANIVNGDKTETPLLRVMALDFASHDLALYLDTHPQDQEAFEVYKELLALSEQAQREYAREYGPIDRRDLLEAKRYTWLEGPWPWEPGANGEV